MTIHPTLSEVAEVARSPLAALVAAVDAAEVRLFDLTYHCASAHEIARASMEELGKIIVAKCEYLASIT